MLTDPLTPEEIEVEKKRLKKKHLRVFYGVSKINKLLKKRAVTIIFENDERGLGEDNVRSVSRWMHIIHTRVQTADEKEDAIDRGRMFHTFHLFIDEKPYKGDWSAVLYHNFLADRFNVSEKERLEIKEKLGIALRKYYDLNVPYQSTLELSNDHPPTTPPT